MRDLKERARVRTSPESPIIQTAHAPKPARKTTAVEDAARYRRRDAHEGFFRPHTRSAAKAQKAKQERNKEKPKGLTNKERRSFAREHYELHHTDKYTKAWSPPTILGPHAAHAAAHATHNNHAELDHTIPLTPPSVHSTVTYQQNRTYYYYT